MACRQPCHGRHTPVAAAAALCPLPPLPLPRRSHISVLGQYALVAAYAVAVLVHNLACLAWLVALMEGLDASWAASVRWSGGPGGLLDAAAPEQVRGGAPRRCARAGQHAGSGSHHVEVDLKPLPRRST